jgi:uncharacterized membrane protein YhaH (DUF805 family)
MQELTFETLIAVFEEIFGRGLFWAMVAAAVLVTLGWIYVLIRDRSLGMRQFLVAQLFMPVGAVLAVWFVMAMTDSHLADIGGPVDVIVFLGIAAMGAVGGAILVYTAEGCCFGGERRRRIELRLASRAAADCTQRNLSAHVRRWVLHPVGRKYCDKSVDGSFSSWHQTGGRLGAAVSDLEMG